MVEPIEVFWQPGCSSCLAAKEFLKRHEVPFASINVRASADARLRLEQLGARTVPVVAQGERYVLAQDLDELAEFVGVVFERNRLPEAVLVERLLVLLDAARRFSVALPAAVLTRGLPGREDRTGLSLAFHVSVIPDAFLDAVEGGELSYDYYLRMPPSSVSDGEALAACFDAVIERLQRWATRDSTERPATLSTYYGDAAFATVLERTTWHVAQHVRQLESLVMRAGGDVSLQIGSEALDGLPLPRAVWDDEVVMG